ncbi:MAG: site-2 protease family protein, partial [Bacteroidota bacterium]
TEYGLGWFPFGGYVQIAGMVDEQMDKSLIDKAPEPWELRSKPAYQRLLVMMGGILMNLIVGIFIFWMVLLVYGKETLPITSIPNGLMVDSAAYNMGLRNGDFITSLDKKPVRSIIRIPAEIIMNGVSTIEGVHANGEKFTLPVNDDDRSKIIKRLKKSNFISPRWVPKIDSIDQSSFAANANIKVGDKVLMMNNTKVLFYDEWKAELVKNRSGKIEFTLLRGQDTVKTTCKVSDASTTGIIIVPTEEFNNIEQKFGFFGAFNQSIKDAIELIVMQAKQFVVIFTVKDAHKQVGGFYTMVQQMSPEWDWHHFWSFTAIISLALAFMNFLPIPMLDGGYIMFILWEMVTGKKVSDKVVYYANNVGLFIVLGLMVYANTDWLRN